MPRRANYGRMGESNTKREYDTSLEESLKRVKKTERENNKKIKQASARKTPTTPELEDNFIGDSKSERESALTSKLQDTLDVFEEEIPTYIKSHQHLINFMEEYGNGYDLKSKMFELDFKRISLDPKSDLKRLKNQINDATKSLQLALNGGKLSKSGQAQVRKTLVELTQLASTVFGEGKYKTRGVGKSVGNKYTQHYTQLYYEKRTKKEEVSARASALGMSKSSINKILKNIDSMKGTPNDFKRIDNQFKNAINNQRLKEAKAEEQFIESCVESSIQDATKKRKPASSADSNSISIQKAIDSDDKRAYGRIAKSMIDDADSNEDYRKAINELVVDTVKSAIISIRAGEKYHVRGNPYVPEVGKVEGKYPEATKSPKATAVNPDKSVEKMKDGRPAPPGEIITALQSPVVSEFVKTTAQFCQALMNTNAEMSKAVSLFSDGAQDMMSGLANPVSSVTSSLVSFMSGMTKGISAALLVVSSSIELCSEIFSIVGKMKGKTGATGKASSATQVVTMIINLISAIFTAFALGMSVISSVIQSGVSMFTGILSTILKMLKTLASTSKLMEQISNIVTLIITMIFLPFFTMIGDSLLTTFFSFLSQMILNGQLFSTFSEAMTTILTSIAKFLSDSDEQIKELAISFIKDFLPDMIKLIPNLLSFALFMMSVFADNIQTICDMVKYGIDAANAMLKNGILAVFLSFGVQAMKFLKNNNDAILKVLKYTFTVADWALGFMSWVTKHLMAFCVLLGAAIVSLISIALAFIGAGGTLQVIGQFMSKRFLAETIAELVAKSGIPGAGLGALIGLVFYESLFAFEKGGYIPSTPGGKMIIVGEKETEYIIPESRMGMVRGHNTIILEFQGDIYGVDNISTEIQAAISDEYNRASYR